MTLRSVAGTLNIVRYIFHLFIDIIVTRKILHPFQDFFGVKVFVYLITLVERGNSCCAFSNALAGLKICLRWKGTLVVWFVLELFERVR